MNSFHYVLAVPYGLETSGTVVFAGRLCQQLIEWGFRVALLHIGEPHHSTGHFKTLIRSGEASESDSPSDRQTGFEIRSSDLANHIVFETPEQMLNWIEYELKCDSIFWGGFFHEPEHRREQVRISENLRKQSGSTAIYMWERTGCPDVIPEQDLFDQFVNEAMDMIAALNVEQRKDLIKKGVPIDKVSLFSTGIDTFEKFDAPTHEEKQSVRKSLGWKPDEVVGISVGRFVERKRMDFVIEAWPNGLPESKKIKLVLLGSGFGADDSNEAKLLELASSRPNVEVVQYRPEMNYEDYFRGADFFVSASIFEGEPTVLQEAMAMKVPIIASRVAGHEMLVKHNWTGLMFDAYDAAQLNDSIMEMATYQHKREMLGENSRTVIIDQRDIRIVAARFLRMSILKRQPNVANKPPLAREKNQ